MSNELLGSKIITEEEAPSLHQIPTVETLVMSFVGIAAQGPVGEATLVDSFADYVKTFGGYIAASDLTAQVEGFFENGGTSCWVVRVVHYTDITNAATKTSAAATTTLLTSNAAATSGTETSANVGPYALAPAQTLVVKVDGGGAQTFTITATAASRTSTTAPFALSDGQTLTLSIDGGSVQTVTFNASAVANIAAVTAAEAASIINGVLIGGAASVSSNAVKITSDRLGTGSGVNVTGGSANGALTYTTGNVAGTGNVSNSLAVTTSEIVSILGSLTGGVAAASGGAVKITSSTTGGASSVQVTSGSTAVAVGFDNAIHSGSASGTASTLTVDGAYDGTYANALKIEIEAATSGDAASFNLLVVDGTGLVLETWSNLTMDSTSPNYVDTIVNDPDSGSNRIKVVDLAVVGTALARRPANVTTGFLTGGLDGLASIADIDYVGSSASATGLRALDIVDDLTLLAVPGIGTSAVHNAMVAYCETARGGQVFPILDPPAGMTPAQVITYFSSTAALEGLSEYGAFYWPRVQVLNPNAAVFGTSANITIGPSGHVAGMYARNDSAKEFGVWTTPAGTENGVLTGVLGFESTDVLKQDVRDLLYPHRINPITTMKRFPRYVDGARVLKGGGNFPTVGQRRGVSFTETSIKLGLQFARLQNLTPELRKEAYRSVYAFLKQMTDEGVFASTDPAKAFFVDFGDALNPASTPNIMTGRIGLATVQPAEYIRLKFSQDTRALDSSNNS